MSNLVNIHNLQQSNQLDPLNILEVESTASSKSLLTEGVSVFMSTQHNSAS